MNNDTHEWTADSDAELSFKRYGHSSGPIAKLAILCGAVLLMATLSSCTSLTSELDQTSYESASVSTAIKSALIDSPGMPAAATLVEADDEQSSITLSGFVDTQEQRAEAERLARQSAPGYRILNELELR